MLEFHKLTGQIEHMGQVLADQKEDIAAKIEIALEILQAHGGAEILPYIQERVQDAVDKDAGYRGARPLDEPIDHAYAPAALPPSATIIATDGSQILPRTHGPALYYLLNTGTIIYHHGSGEVPDIVCDPFLFYEREYMITEDRGLVTAAMVGARRTVSEMAALSEQAWLHRGEARPMIALLDNPLLMFGLSREIPDRDALLGIYFSAMSRLMEVHAGLAGYTERPRSRYVTALLHLLDLPEEAVSRSALSTDGRLEGLFDMNIFRHILQPAERSALFVQMSPQNKEFRRVGGESHEIVFFYQNVAAAGEPANIVRIEVPMWVAEDRKLIGEIQSLVYHQSQQLISRYPYVLTRAHELAVVNFEETLQLEAMIRISLTRHGLAGEESEKQLGKDAVSGPRTRFEMR